MCGLLTPPRSEAKVAGQTPNLATNGFDSYMACFARKALNLYGKVRIKECGKEIYKTSTLCIKCNSKNNRKTKRPSYNILKEEIKKLGYTGTGRKYNVSDNAIRKWIKYYENH